MKKIKGAVLILLVTLVISIVPIKSARAAENTVAQGEQVQSENSAVDEASSEDEESEEVEIAIDDEEVPLYADSGSETSYVIYVWIVAIGALLIFGGVYLFYKRESD